MLATSHPSLDQTDLMTLQKSNCSGKNKEIGMKFEKDIKQGSLNHNIVYKRQEYFALKINLLCMGVNNIQVSIWMYLQQVNISKAKFSY